MKKAADERIYYFRAFFYAAAISCIFLVPFIIYDKGLFIYYGDFNVQQIPFYQTAHDAIRRGEFFWNWNTDLGANFIGSYSFYLLTSPFFLLTLPFPSQSVPYLMGPLLILKLSCASLCAFVYLKRYTKTPDIALIGALLYAFSGFSVYNIFFNHFHEAIIVFPLLLWALDRYMYENARGIFAVLVFASCILNYYFFTGQVVFLLLYWFIKLLLGEYRCGARKFAWLVFESVLGVAATSVVLLPTILCITQNPRLADFFHGWDALLYHDEQRYIHILQCLFFPPDIPARPNFTPDSNAKWSSLAAWLPLFSMSGVIAFFKAQKEHWLKRLLIVLLVMSAVPILNSTFQLLNPVYYARWFYMLALMLVLATVFSLENCEADWPGAIKNTIYISLAIALPIGLMPKTSGSGEDKQTTIGLMEYPLRFWVYVAFALLCLVVLLEVFLYAKQKNIAPYRILTAGVAVAAVFYSGYIITIGKMQSYSSRDYVIPYCINQGDKINLPDTQNCRCDVYHGMDNQAMFWKIPTIQAFHSIVPGSVMEFYESVGVKRDVASRPETNVYGVRALTSCRWLFDYTKDDSSFAGPGKEPAMPGWRHYDTQNDFDIWENEYFIPYGFSYDHYISRQEYDKIAEDKRHLMLLKAIVLSDEQIDKYGDFLSPIQSTGVLNYLKNAYFNDCTARKESACPYFKRDKHGFTAKTSVSPKDRLVFFSVPYEKGWSATVNGEKAEIEKVNVGFMAVKAPKNKENTIVFTYETPGLKLGAVITIASFLVFALYLYLLKKNPKFMKIPRRRVYTPATQSDRDILRNRKC